jgi:hypothetical protein
VSESDIQRHVDEICRIASDAIRAGHEVELTIGTRVVYRYNFAVVEEMGGDGDSTS